MWVLASTRYDRIALAIRRVGGSPSSFVRAKAALTQDDIRTAQKRSAAVTVSQVLLRADC